MPSRLRASERLRSCFLWFKNMALLRVGGGEVEAKIRALSGDVKAILQGLYRELADYFGALLFKQIVLREQYAFLQKYRVHIQHESLLKECAVGTRRLSIPGYIYIKI